MTLGELVDKLGRDTPILGEPSMTADGAIVGRGAVLWGGYPIGSFKIQRPPGDCSCYYSTREAALAGMGEKA